MCHILRTDDIIGFMGENGKGAIHHKLEDSKGKQFLFKFDLQSRI